MSRESAYNGHMSQSIQSPEQPTLAMTADAAYDPRDEWTDEQYDQADREYDNLYGIGGTFWDGWDDEPDQPPF